MSDPGLALALALTVADFGQTRTIADNPRSYYEYNRILGKHPSIGAVNTYFLASAAVHTTLHYVLPEPWRKYHDYLWIGTSAVCVGNNLQAGIRMTF